MGQRSRKRGNTRPAAAPGPASSAAGRRRARDAAPPAPWGSFPLVELGVLIALVLGVVGFVVRGRTGLVLVVCAGALGSLGGLEVAVREHLAGYRSHTTLLAGAAAVGVLALLVALRVVQVALPIVGAGVFVGAFVLLRRLFRRRSGGLSFRVR